jgi:hypothetical protein
MLAMGDFDDEPFDTSRSARAQHSAASQVHLGAGGAASVESDVADRRRAPDGSFCFDSQPNADEFLVNKNRQPWSIQVSTRSQSPSAEWASRSIRTDSDHFPITRTVTEVD